MRLILTVLTATTLSISCGQSMPKDAAMSRGADADADADADTDADADADTDADADGSPPDTDADDDGVSVEAGDCDDTDPDLGAQSLDYDCDGLSDLDETIWTSDPSDPDTDGDWVMDGDDARGSRSPIEAEPLTLELAEGESIRVHLVRTPTYRPVDLSLLIQDVPDGHVPANAMAAELASISAHLTTQWPQYDWAYGLGAFADYALAPYGYSESGDRPFKLYQRTSKDLDDTLEGLSTFTVGFGGDAANSVLEGIQQALTGTGYDQNCDGIFDEGTDLLPAQASGSDLFSGLAGGLFNSTDGGLGMTGSMGLRAESRPIVIYMQDGSLRDPDRGYGSPGGCPEDATAALVTDSVAAADATLIGVHFSSWGGAVEDMEELAGATGSLGNLDDDPSTLEPLVLTWTGSTSGLRDTLQDAIDAALAANPPTAASFETDAVTVSVDGDEHGFVSALGPEAFPDITAGSDDSELRFVLTATGTVPAAADAQRFTQNHLRLLGASGENMGVLPMSFEVPGSSPPD